MAVVLLIPNDWDIPSLLRWGCHFARADGSDLYALLMPTRTQLKSVSKSANSATVGPDSTEESAELIQQIEGSCPADFAWVPVQVANASDAPAASPDSVAESAGLPEGQIVDSAVVGKVESPEPEAPTTAHQLIVRRLSAQSVTAAIRHQIALADAQMLIVPRDAGQRSDAEEFSIARHMLHEVACTVVQLRPGDHTGDECRSIIVPCADNRHIATALKLAVGLAEANDGNVLALHVQPDVDDVGALVGRKTLTRILKNALGKRQERVEELIELSDDVAGTIAEVRQRDHDLLLFSAEHHSAVHQLLFRGITERFVRSRTGPPVAVIRRAVPLTHRVRQMCDAWIRSRIPQLEHESRAELVRRIQSGSKLNIDFIALTCLSSLIATMGLLQDSVAVVIGAMLVAPLMTPLIGAGLALVQQNIMLIRDSIQSVSGGFLLAFLVGLGLGAAIRMYDPAAAPSGQMWARGSPGLLDFFVALVSGIAAAYALSQPHLNSALPGVAIAAALVPPITTSGAALAYGEYRLSGGALLLFLTNIVAIVLGTILTMSAVGFHISHKPSMRQAWARAIFGILLATTFGLGMYKYVLNQAFPPKLKSEVVKLIEARPGIECIDMRYRRENHKPQLYVTVNAPRTDALLAQDILTLIRHAKHGDQHQRRGIRVIVETHFITSTDAKLPKSTSQAGG